MLAGTIVLSNLGMGGGTLLTLGAHAHSEGYI